MTATKKSAATEAVEEVNAIKIEKVDIGIMRVPIIGTSPLIVNNFSEKSRRQMLESQQGKKRVKEIRDPKVEYESAFYRISSAEEGGPDRYGFPVTAFKAATTGAARFYDKSVSMTALRQFVFMQGIETKADPQQLVEIFGEPEMREDVVRLGGASRSADLRYRPVFPTGWTAVLTVMWARTSIDQNSVLSLIDAGGMGIGVGEWRPEKRGQFGCYEIDSTRELETLQ
jgi:hypothetical protein